MTNTPTKLIHYKILLSFHSVKCKFEHSMGVASCKVGVTNNFWCTLRADTFLSFTIALPAISL